MGAWGIGAFENDDATDWLYELADSTDLSVVRSALEAGDDEYLEAPDGAVRVAAAEVISALVGQPSSGLPDAVRQWVTHHTDLVEGRDARSALAAVDRVAGDASELKELWGQAADAGWHRTMADLRRRLEISS